MVSHNSLPGQHFSNYQVLWIQQPDTPPTVKCKGFMMVNGKFLRLTFAFSISEKMHKNIDFHPSDKYFPMKISPIALCTSLVVIQSKFLLFDKFLRLTRWKIPIITGCQPQIFACHFISCIARNETSESYAMG